MLSVLPFRVPYPLVPARAAIAHVGPCGPASSSSRGAAYVTFRDLFAPLRHWSRGRPPVPVIVYFPHNGRVVWHQPFAETGVAAKACSSSIAKQPKYGKHFSYKEDKSIGTYPYLARGTYYVTVRHLE